MPLGATAPVPVAPVVPPMVVTAIRVDTMLDVDVPVVMGVRPKPAELLDGDDGEENGEDRQREALRSDQDALVEQRRSLAERQEAVQAREADADAGFVTRRERALEELQQAHNALLERNTRLHEQITQREQAHLERVTEQQDAHNARLEAFRSKVQEQLEQQSQERLYFDFAPFYNGENSDGP